MGGEPTLHSEFKKIIDYALTKDFSVQIFTNGLFPVQIKKFLSSKKDKIKYSFNINLPDQYGKRQWDLIIDNLKELSQHNNCLIGSVIYQEKFILNHLADLANKYPVKIIMIRIANPIIGNNNQYIPFINYPTLAKNIIKEVQKVNQKRIRIGFGCGLSKKMFNKNQLKILKEYNIANLKWGCNANSGRFDIGTDLSVFRCFPLSGWQKKNLLDFSFKREIEDYFENSMLKYQFSKSNKDYVHQGPCFSHLLSKNL